MHMLYVWASVITPLIGMVFSMISHRYAYMNTAMGASLIFTIAAVHLYLKMKR